MVDVFMVEDRSYNRRMKLGTQAAYYKSGNEEQSSEDAANG